MVVLNKQISCQHGFKSNPKLLWSNQKWNRFHQEFFCYISLCSNYYCLHKLKNYCPITYGAFFGRITGNTGLLMKSSWLLHTFRGVNCTNRTAGSGCWSNIQWPMSTLVSSCWTAGNHTWCVSMCRLQGRWQGQLSGECFFPILLLFVVHLMPSVVQTI